MEVQEVTWHVVGRTSENDVYNVYNVIPFVCVRTGQTEYL